MENKELVLRLKHLIEDVEERVGDVADLMFKNRKNAEKHDLYEDEVWKLENVLDGLETALEYAKKLKVE